MIKDRPQKQKVLRYIISKDWFPQLEVDVSTRITTSDKVINITDIDVMASIPDDFSGYRYLIVDCKSGWRTPPMARALWQKGLMSRVRADRGICISGKSDIEADHRYTAAELGINVLSEREFEVFASATSSRYNVQLGSLANIDIWDQYFSIPSSYKTLYSAIVFSRSGYWMAESAAEACRKTIVQLWKLRPELDPDKNEHVTIVGDISALFMHSLAIIVNNIFTQYLQPTKKDELSNALLYLIYGGRASYQMLNRLKQMIISPAGSEKVEAAVSLPDWDAFVQLVRQTLDSPVELYRVPLLIREIAWSILARSKDREFARGIASRFPQGARFAVLGIDYLCKAAQLPPEFKTIWTSELMSVQVPK